MTAAGVDWPPSGLPSARGSGRPGRGWLACGWCACTWPAAAHWPACWSWWPSPSPCAALHWMPRGGLASRQLPLTIQAGAAALIGVTTRSPFGEPERATGRWLPLLRLGTVMVLAGAAVGVLAAGPPQPTWPAAPWACATLPGSPVSRWGPPPCSARPGLGRAAGLPGGHPARSQAAWTTPWVWPARPPHDRGAALCAALVLSPVVVITVRGARDTAS